MCARALSHASEPNAQRLEGPGRLEGGHIGHADQRLAPVRISDRIRVGLGLMESRLTQ
jgi:hypothetical protein